MSAPQATRHGGVVVTAIGMQLHEADFRRHTDIIVNGLTSYYELSGGKENLKECPSEWHDEGLMFVSSFAGLWACGKATVMIQVGAPSLLPRLALTL